MPSILEPQPRGFCSYLIWLSLIVVAFLSWRIVYNIYIHPLSKYPGPKLAAASNMYNTYWSMSGQIPAKLNQLHSQYGDVVRWGPNTLIYRSAKSWKDIYGHRKNGAGAFNKDSAFYINGPTGPNILTANGADHSRMRRLLSHAFSERALREQEPLLQSYVDLLVQRIQERISVSSKPIDMTKWYNYTTFDIVGDLAFGEPFDCLKDSRYHPWVSAVFRSVKAGLFLRLLRYVIPPWLVQMLIPSKLKKMRNDHYLMSKEKVNRRISLQTRRPDFMTYVLRATDEKAMGQNEIESNAALLILAGSETTASLLCGFTFYILTNHNSYLKLVNEIRGNFQKEEEITVSSTSELSYLHCVLEESLRLYPPVPGVIPRLVPEGGAVIDEQFVPEGTVVSTAFTSAFRSTNNFHDPDSFIPERWLEDREHKFASDSRESMQAFSIGPRNCLGKNLAYAEMRLIVAKLLWNFDMVLEKESYSWRDQKSYIVWEKPPLMVKLTPAKAFE